MRPSSNSLRPSWNSHFPGWGCIFVFCVPLWGVSFGEFVLESGYGDLQVGNHRASDVPMEGSCESFSIFRRYHIYWDGVVTLLDDFVNGFFPVQLQFPRTSWRG